MVHLRSRGGVLRLDGRIGGRTGPVEPVPDYRSASDTALQFRSFVIAPGKEEVLADLKGPGKVTYFYFTDDSGGKLDPGLVLKVYWDGTGSPASTCPWRSSSER